MVFCIFPLTNIGSIPSLFPLDIVVCAGHCLPPHRYQHETLIQVGLYERGDDDDDDDDDVYDDDNIDNNKVTDGDVEVFTIANMIRHPNWHRLGDDSFASDFAVIQLNGTSTKPFVRINRDPTIPTGMNVTAMGMGITSSDELASTLQQVELTALSNEECAASRGRHMSYKHMIDDSHMCTGWGEHNTRDAW